MCTQPRRLLLTPDIGRMCLLWALVLLLLYSRHQRKHVSVNLLQHLITSALGRGGGIRVWTQAFLAIISLFLSSIWGLYDTPCFVLLQLSSGCRISLTSVAERTPNYAKRFKYIGNKFFQEPNTVLWCHQILALRLRQAGKQWQQHISPN